MKVQVKFNGNDWLVIINGKEYANGNVKSVADAIAATVKRDFNRHGYSAAFKGFEAS